jgi:hypothetical protein
LAGTSKTLKRELEKPPPEGRGLFVVVRPAGRNYLEVKVLYSPGKGKS